MLMIFNLRLCKTYDWFYFYVAKLLKKYLISKSQNVEHGCFVLIKRF